VPGEPPRARVGLPAGRLHRRGVGRCHGPGGEQLGFRRNLAAFQAPWRAATRRVGLMALLVDLRAVVGNGRCV